MLLKRLSEAIGVSGHEDEVRSLILEELRGKVDECRIDAMGNLIAVRRGTVGSPARVLAAAHMDEVGLMVTQIEDTGLLRFAKVGGIDDRVLPARAVLVGDARVPGVIASKPVHLTDKGERERVTEAKQLTIDIGASSRSEAEKLVHRGDCVVFLTEFLELKADGPWKAVRGKALDDRVGCAVLIELLGGERLPFDLVAAFTVQEEVGLRGARVAAYAENPRAAFVLECTASNEVPSRRDLSPSTRLGQGPAITLMDNSFFADPRLVEHVISTAQRLGIPHQVKQPNIGGTDAGAIQRVREGVPAITIAVPARYIHSPAAIMNADDFDATVALVREALPRLPEAFDGARRAT
ncbi:MAG TPA: M42 family metallopeptidase [Spirochaetia bacterium]|nr:M42 family metallopeptidase [Spirochaetia bacterium]